MYMTRQPVTIEFALYLLAHCRNLNHCQFSLVLFRRSARAWVTEGGDLSTADWGCLAGRCASLCLQAARGGCAAGGSG